MRRSPAETGHRAHVADPRDPSTRGKTRGLTEGAVLAALTAVVAAVGLVIPFVGILLAPLPVMLLVMRWGMRTAVMAAVVACLILLQFFGPMVALSVTVIFAPLGLALGWGVRRGIGAQATVLVGAAAFLLSLLATYALTALLLHQDLLGQLIRAQVQAMQQSAALLQRFGAKQEEIDAIRLYADPQCGEHHCFPPLLEQFVKTVAPVGFAIGALFWGYLCYSLGRSVFRRIGYDIAAVPPILSWRVRPALAAGLLWASAGLAFASLWAPWIAGPGLSAVLVNLFVFAFQGTLVGITWMNGRRVPRLAQIFAGLLVFRLGLPALLALAVIGILDTWYDYRRLIKPPSPGAAPDEGKPESPPRVTAPAARARRGQRIKAVDQR